MQDGESVQSAPLAAVVAPLGEAFLAGLWTAFASSKAAGEWIMRVTGAGVVLTAVVFVLALAAPQHRRITQVMC